MENFKTRVFAGQIFLTTLYGIIYTAFCSHVRTLLSSAAVAVPTEANPFSNHIFNTVHYTHIIHDERYMVYITLSLK